MDLHGFRHTNKLCMTRSGVARAKYIREHKRFIKKETLSDETIQAHWDRYKHLKSKEL